MLFWCLFHTLLLSVETNKTETSRASIKLSICNSCWIFFTKILNIFCDVYWKKIKLCVKIQISRQLWTRVILSQNSSKVVQRHTEDFSFRLIFLEIFCGSKLRIKTEISIHLYKQKNIVANLFKAELTQRKVFVWLMFLKFTGKQAAH